MVSTNRNVLITGGAGFIGSALALQLLESGYVVTVLDNLSLQIHGENPEKSSTLYQSIIQKVRFIQGDVRHLKDCEQAIENQDFIIHLASETGTGQSMYEIRKYIEVNELGTANLLEVLANQSHRIQKIILASSRAVYGEGKYQHPNFGEVFPNTRKKSDLERGIFDVFYRDLEPLKFLPTDENSAINPQSVYAVSKYNQEQLITTVGNALGISTVILRFQNVYGEGQSLQNPYTGILSIFSTQIRNYLPIEIFEDGQESRDFIHISDAVQAIISTLSNSVDSTLLNIGTGVSTSVAEVANLLCKSLKKEVPIQISGNFRLGDIRHNVAEISKAKEILNFQPKISIQQGIQQFSDWVVQQEMYESKTSKALQEMKSKGLMKN